MAKTDVPTEVVNEAPEVVEKAVKSKDAKQVIYLGPNSAELGLTTAPSILTGFLLWSVKTKQCYACYSYQLTRLRKRNKN